MLLSTTTRQVGSNPILYLAPTSPEQPPFPFPPTCYSFPPPPPNNLQLGYGIVIFTTPFPNMQ